MAQSLSVTRLFTSIVAASLCMANLMDCAWAMNDPTRPPDVQAAEQPNPYDQPVLQSVLFSAGRKGAIINGQTVPLGGKFGDARLTRITETEVTLESAAGLKVLKLYPAVEKSMISKVPSRTARKPAHRGKPDIYP